MHRAVDLSRASNTVVACGYTPRVARCQADRIDSGGVRLGEAFKRALQRFIWCGSFIAEFDFRLIDINIRRESRFMNGIAGGREVTQIGEP